MEKHALSVGEVVERTLLVNDADGGLLGANADALDVVGGLAHSLELVVHGVCGLDGGLGVELGGEGDLEEDVLHDVRAVGALELERLALKENIVEAPGLGGQDGGETLLTLLDEEGEVDGARAGVTGSPGLARAGVGRVAVGTEGLAVNPRLRDRIDGLLPVEAKELGDDGGRGDLDEDNVIETDAVVRVEESKTTLDLVCLDHGLEDVMDSQRLSLAGEVISDSEDSAQVVGRMTPYNWKIRMIWNEQCREEVGTNTRLRASSH